MNKTEKMDKLNKVKYVVVHDGVFHADDVMVCAFMSIICKHDISIIRTRKITPEMLNSEEYLVADVGGVYCPEKLLFDHHQKHVLCEGNGHMYAAFGQVYKEFGRIAFPNDIDYNNFKSSYVDFIDDADNGVNMNPLSRAISSFIPEWNSESSLDDMFDDAFLMACRIIHNEIDKAKSRAEAFKEVDKDVDLYNERSGNTAIVYIGKYKPWQTDKVIECVDYILYDSHDGESIMVQAVPVERGSFIPKRPFPEEWQGLRGEDFVKESGVRTAIFCHAAGFLASCKSLEDAINLAQLSLYYHDDDVLKLYDLMKENDYSLRKNNLVICERKASHGRINNLYNKIIDTINNLEDLTSLLFIFNDNSIVSEFGSLIAKSIRFNEHVLGPVPMIEHVRGNDIDIDMIKHELDYRPLGCNKTIVFIESIKESDIHGLLQIVRKYDVKIYTTKQLPLL